MATNGDKTKDTDKPDDTQPVRTRLTPPGPIAAGGTIGDLPLDTTNRLGYPVAAPTGLGMSAPSAIMPGPGTIANTQVPSKLGTVARGFGNIIGNIGRDVGSAALQFAAPWAAPFVPGTIQHQMFETARERGAERFKTAEEEKQAQTAQYNAESEARQREWSKPVPTEGGTWKWDAQKGDWALVPEGGKTAKEPREPQTPEERATYWDKYGGGANDPRRGEYILTGKMPVAKEGEEKPFETAGGLMWTNPANPKPVMLPGQTMPPVPGDTISGQLAPAAPLPPQQAKAIEKPVKDEKENKAVGGMINGKPAWGVQTEKGWVDPETLQPIPNFQPPPSFAETGLWQPTMINQNGTMVPGMLNARTGQVLPTSAGSPTIIPKDIQPEINRIMDTARGADTRFGVMIDNEQPALAGNQQAMINILANHMGMTQGLQKGSRINQAMWNEATASAPFIDRVLSKFTKVDPDTGDRIITGPLSGVTLTPQQIKQMVDLGHDRRVREWQQALHTATQNGLNIAGTIPNDIRGDVMAVEKKEQGKSLAGGGAATGDAISDAIKAFRAKQAKGAGNP